MSDESTSLNIQLSERGALVVVSFQGCISKKTSPQIEECKSALFNKKPRCVVLNFQGLTQMDFPGVAAVIQLKKALRDQGASLRLCYLRKKFAQMLEDKGALRRSELSVDLREALTEFRDLMQA